MKSARIHYSVSKFCTITLYLLHLAILGSVAGNNTDARISLEDYFKSIDFSYRREPSHPVLPPFEILPPEKLEELKKNVAAVMDMSYKDIATLIDEQGDVSFHYSPDGGTFLWDIKRPWQLVDSKSGRVFPNKDCPMKELQVIDPTGMPQSYFYYENGKGDQFFFKAYCRTFIRNYFVDRVLDLTQLYSQTGDIEYARKALLILARFAEAYPHWPYRSYIKNERGWFRNVMISSMGDKIAYNFWGGKWQSRWCNAEIQYNGALVRAYDATYNSDILSAISKEVGFDAKTQIEEKLLRGMVEEVLKYPVEYFDGNPAGHIIANLAITGIALGYPELVHLAYSMLDNLIQRNFLFDNMWRESSVNYHDMTLKLITKTIDALNGYSDPTGFTGKDGKHFENLVFNIDKFRKAPNVLSFPNGYIVPINDARTSSSLTEMKPRNEIASSQFTGFLSATGHVSLGCGRGNNQIQYHLSFTDDRGHRHNDMLNTIMFAYGREMISDIGYSHSGLRPWSASTLAHNTVLIDGQMQKCKDGSLIYLLPNVGPVTAVEAQARGVFSRCEAYRRFAALIDDNDENLFIIDIFRITGGAVHDWVLHGSSDEEMTLNITPPLSETKGSWLGKDTKYLPGRDEYSSGKLMQSNREIKTGMKIKDTPDGYVTGPNMIAGFHPFYGIVKSAWQGKTNTTVKASFAYTKDTDTGFNIYILNKDTTEIFSGFCPSIRNEWHYLNNAPDSIPIFLCRRNADENKTGVFASVIEPFKGKQFIRSVKDIKASGDNDAVGISVITTNKTHMILNTVGNGGKIKTPKAELEGRLGVIALQNERPSTFFLSDGSSLTYGDWQIKALDNYKGTIYSVNRSIENNLFSFDTKADIPEGSLLKDNIVIVTFDKSKSYGYKISHVGQITGGSRIFLAQEPGFIIKENNSCFLFYPRKSYKGLPVFTIPNKVMINIAPDKISLEANTSVELKTPGFSKTISLRDLQALNGVLIFKL